MKDCSDQRQTYVDGQLVDLSKDGIGILVDVGLAVSWRSGGWWVEGILLQYGFTIWRGRVYPSVLFPVDMMPVRRSVSVDTDGVTDISDFAILIALVRLKF